MTLANQKSNELEKQNKAYKKLQVRHDYKKAFTDDILATKKIPKKVNNGEYFGGTYFE